MRKCIVLLLIMCLGASSLSAFTVPYVSAQVGYQPSVPQFSVTFVDTSYDVPTQTRTTVDQYTGKETTTTYPCYHVNQTTVKITIKNQLFKPYTNEWGQETYLYYNVEIKGHFSENWIWFSDSHITIYRQSDSAYTVLSAVSEYEANAQVDFRVRAVISFPANSFSEWSKVQTVTVPASSSLQITTTLPHPSTTTHTDGNDQPHPPDQTQTPNNVFSNPFFMLGVGALFAGVVVVVVMVFRSRHLSSVVFEVEGRS